MGATAVGQSALVSEKIGGLHLIDRLVLGYRGAKVLFTAASLDAFTAVHEGFDTAETLSRRLKTKPRPTGVLMDAMVALGFLTKRGQRYSNTPVSEKHLVASSRHYLGHNLMYQDAAWGCWGELRRLTQTGRTPASISHWLARSPDFAKAYIRGMDDISMRPARAIAELLPLPSARLILDVGAGPGAYTRALLEKNPALRGELFDLPASLSVARDILADSPLRSRLTLRGGNYHTSSLGRAAYDVVLLSHVTHNEDDGANLKLLRKCHAALRPRGLVVIHDFLTDDDGTGPIFAALLSLQMMVTTGTGQIYSRKTYTAWLEKVGFDRVRVERVPSDLENPTWLVIATKH